MAPESEGHDDLAGHASGGLAGQPVLHRQAAVLGQVAAELTGFASEFLHGVILVIGERRSKTAIGTMPEVRHQVAPKREQRQRRSNLSTLQRF
jgi:hypothetical protein